MNWVHFFPVRRWFWVHYVFNVNCALEAHVFEHLILSGLLSWETVEPLSEGALQEEVENWGRLWGCQASSCRPYVPWPAKRWASSFPKVFPPPQDHTTLSSSLRWTISPFNLWAKKPPLLARYLVTMVSKHGTAKRMLPLSHNIHHRVSPWAANYRESHTVGQDESVKLRDYLSNRGPDGQVQPARWDRFWKLTRLWRVKWGDYFTCAVCPIALFWKPQLVHMVGDFRAVLYPVKVLWASP